MFPSPFRYEAPNTRSSSFCAEDSGVSGISIAADDFGPRRKKPSKPNTLPVLNCLFSALKYNNNNNDDTTPYCDVPTTPQGNDFMLRPRIRNTPQTPTPPSQKSSNYMTESCSTSESSGDTLPGGKAMGKSKSAHVISCEVYTDGIYANPATLLPKSRLR